MQQQIIHFLKESKTHVSGEQMSEQLGISRAAVWKYIDQLRQEGYEIAAIPHIGYKLESSPDRLLPHEITYGLKTRYIGRETVVKENTASTMDDAFALGMAGCPQGTVVCAETQTRGRGRLGRQWLSPKDKGLYFSIVFRPDFAISQMPSMTLMSAVALVEAIRMTCQLEVQIKWPNDILIDGKKLAGILTEMRAEMDQVKMVVIGIGVNVNSTGKELMEQATSLKTATRQQVNRVVLLQNIFERLEFWYETFNSKGMPPILKQWTKYCDSLGSRVRVSQGASIVEGIAQGLGADGSLLIRQASGKIHQHIAGDVQVLS